MTDMRELENWLDKDTQRCAWCPAPARGHAWHNDSALHPSCGQIDHGRGWVPGEVELLVENELKGRTETIREAKAEAWDEGSSTMRDIYGDTVETNPYRQEQDA